MSILGCSSGDPAPQPFPIDQASPVTFEKAELSAELPDFSLLFRKVSPSVVNVSAYYESPFSQDILSIQNHHDRAISKSLGSGFVFEAGFIVTCGSVVQGAGKVSVSFAKGPTVPAQIVASDDASDLAVLKVGNRFGRPLPLAPKGSVHQGDWVAALGYPYGLSRSMTAGVVSSIRTKEQLGSLTGLIVSDAAVNPGCNGGPLLNTKDEVVGINLVSNREEDELGLSVPIHDVWGLIQILKQGKIPKHAWLGISTQFVDSSLAKAFGLGQASGALISRVLPSSPAAKAGLERGDVIIKFAGHRVDDPITLVGFVRKAQVGRKVYVELIRDSVRKKIAIVPVSSDH